MSVARALANLRSINRVLSRRFSSDDAPIKYTTSGAAKWKAETTRRGPENKRLWYEPYVILGSLSVFMVYFCYLREENDIDKELQKSLYSRIEGLEEHQLKVALEFNDRRGKDTSDIKQRLNELEVNK